MSNSIKAFFGVDCSDNMNAEQTDEKVRNVIIY